ncbi:MAG: hypothetical protein IPO27_17125 [Bacteroidetes bacterium]|nr:hypothetical protein [Bacteroidota bacterium]
MKQQIWQTIKEAKFRYIQLDNYMYLQVQSLKMARNILLACTAVSTIAVAYFQNNYITLGIWLTGTLAVWLMANTFWAKSITHLKKAKANLLSLEQINNQLEVLWRNLNSKSITEDEIAGIYLTIQATLHLCEAEIAENKINITTQTSEHTNERLELSLRNVY